MTGYGMRDCINLSFNVIIMGTGVLNLIVDSEAWAFSVERMHSN